MRLLTFLSVCAALGGCSYQRPATAPAPAESTRDRMLIEQAFDRWLDAYERGDPNSLADIFSEDAIYAANTGEVLVGRDGIRSGVAAWMHGSSRVGQQRPQAKLDVQRQSIRFRQAGPLAYDLLRFTITMTPPGCLIDAGHAQAVWEKQPDGRWLLDALTVNQDKTPPSNACRLPRAAAKAQAAPAGRAIDAQFVRWIEAFEGGDANALSLLFSEDGIYAPNTGQVFRGRDAIRAGVDAWFKGPLAPLYQPGGPKVAVERSPLRVEYVDGAAYMLNRFVVRLEPPGCVLDIGHILLVWRRQASGEWLIDSMLGNQDKQPFPDGCVQ